MKYFIKTFGCQMNVSDSSLVAGTLESFGMLLAESEKEADVIVLNTCTVRFHAEHRALSYIGRLRPFKRIKPDLKIIVTGCVAQRMGLELKKKFQIVDLVVGAREIEHFEEIYTSVFGTEGSGADKKFTHILPRAKESPVASFVTIMRGCNNYCSYCIVPYVRGPEISRPVKEIIDEIKSGLELGLQEVVLLGQNVNSYNDQGKDFTDLLEEVNKIDGLKRIRFMTSHPKDLSSKLIDSFGRLDKLCEHIHLPLQSGSDKILKAMNRNYTRDSYLKLIEELRSKVPNISITTDILTGFPGETEEDINLTLDVMKKCAFNSVFAFKYSAREGTASFNIPETISAEEKERRHLLVQETADKISIAKHAELINSTQNVLVEKTENNICTGRTRGNLKVFFEEPEGIKLNSQMADVKITKTKINTLTGLYTG
jgi:tRNA-2-methylthio-N6-dimethylallyladenosine synthase